MTKDFRFCSIEPVAKQWQMTGEKPPEAKQIGVTTREGYTCTISKKAFDRLSKVSNAGQADDVFRSYASSVPHCQRNAVWQAIEPIADEDLAVSNLPEPIRLEYDSSNPVFADKGKIKVNSIQIPDAYVDLCGSWHGSTSCLLYAIASTGGLTTGTDNRHDSVQAWYANLFQELSIDIDHVAEIADKSEGMETDAELLREFGNWVDHVAELLLISYGIDY